MSRLAGALLMTQRVEGLYDARVLFLLIIAVLLVTGGAAAMGGMYLAEKRRRALKAGTTHALPAGDSGNLLERTLRDLRVNDVVTIDAKDYLVEGVMSYDEDGHRWSAGRLVDGSKVIWLMIGIERVGASPLRLLEQDAETEISGYPPEAMVVGTTRYQLDRRGTATCKLAGELGTLTGVKDKRPDNHVERCRWWLYDAAGDDTMVLEQWGGEYRVLRGKKAAAETIDLIPGS